MTNNLGDIQMSLNIKLSKEVLEKIIINAVRDQLGDMADSFKVDKLKFVKNTVDITLVGSTEYKQPEPTVANTTQPAPVPSVPSVEDLISIPEPVDVVVPAVTVAQEPEHVTLTETREVPETKIDLTKLGSPNRDKPQEVIPEVKAEKVEVDNTKIDLSKFPNAENTPQINELASFGVVYPAPKRIDCETYLKLKTKDPAQMTDLELVTNLWFEGQPKLLKEAFDLQYNKQFDKGVVAENAENLDVYSPATDVEKDYALWYKAKLLLNSPNANVRIPSQGKVHLDNKPVGAHRSIVMRTPAGNTFEFVKFPAEEKFICLQDITIDDPDAPIPF